MLPSSSKSRKGFPVRLRMSKLGSGLLLISALSFSLAGPAVARPRDTDAPSADFDPWLMLRKAGGWLDQVGGGVHGHVVQGNRLYAAVGGRLHAYDIADPARPRLLGRSDAFFALELVNEEGQEPWSEVILAAHDGSVYATGGPDGLLGIDVTDPAMPRLTLYDSGGGSNYRQLMMLGDDLIEHHGDTSFLSWWEPLGGGGLSLRALSEFTRLDLLHVAIRSRDRRALGFELHGQILEPPAIHMFQLDPAVRDYASLGRLPLKPDASITSMQLRDRFGVALQSLQLDETRTMEFLVLDVRAPDKIAIQASLPLASTWQNVDPKPAYWQSRVNAEVVASETHAFVPIAPGGIARVASIDLREPALPVMRGSAAISGNAGDLSIDGQRLFVSSQVDLATTHANPPAVYAGVEAFDIANPDRPRAIGAIGDAWNAIDVAAYGAHAVVAAASSGLRVIDAGNPVEAKEVGALTGIGDVTSVEPAGESRFAVTVAAGSQQGLIVIDLANPAAPRILGRLALPQHAEVVDLAILGAVAAVVTFDGFVHVVDIADPAAPRLLATVDAAPAAPAEPLPPRNPVRQSVFARAIAAEGHTAYVGVNRGDEQAAWVVAVDLTNPTAPVIAATVPVDPLDAFKDPHIDIRDIAIDAGRVAVAVGGDVRLFRADSQGRLASTGRTTALRAGLQAVAWRGPTLAIAHNEGHDIVDLGAAGSLGRLAVRQSFPLAAEPWRRHGGLAFLADGRVLQAHGTQGLLLARAVDPPVPPTTSPTATPTVSVTPPPTMSMTPLSTPTGIEPTVTPTATSTARPSPSATPTSIRTAPPPTATSPSPTATVAQTAPARLFLPLALSLTCPPKDEFVDVVLVIDASTSMNEPAGDGRRKLDVVLSAVREFTRGIRLTAGKDRAALVTFNARANLVQALTHDPRLIDAALAKVQTDTRSRVDLGVQRAADELVIRGKPGRGQAIVLLSDGLVNPVPAAEAVSAAARARQQGATIWVVGLGPKLDETTLREMASGAGRYQRADSVLAVEAIYRDLTRKVPCPSQRYWAGR